MRECYVCKTTNNIQSHHVYGGFNRKNSTKYGMVVDLCGYHHNLSNKGVHQNRELDLRLKQEYQQKFENEQGTREEFMSIFGKNYLD